MYSYRATYLSRTGPQEIKGSYGIRKTAGERAHLLLFELVRGSYQLCCVRFLGL